jgi:Transposase, Mutator family
VRCPRVRDRGGQGLERIRFSSAILPPYARRSKSLEVLIPMLYLKGVSTGDFEEALLALLGKDAGGLSASTIGRLKEATRSCPRAAQLHLPNAAAQTRMVSIAGIRLRSWESARAFKGIFCHDISEFESYMPSHAVRSRPAKM